MAFLGKLVPSYREFGEKSPAPCVAATSEDGGVLLDLDHDRLLKLNSVGVEIWKLLSAGDTEPQIISKIVNKYSVDPQRVAGDVHALRRKIAELGLVPGTSVFSAFGDGAPLTASHGKQPSFPWYGQDGINSKPDDATFASVLSAFLGLATFDIILSFLSLKRLCFCVKKWPTKAGPPADSNAIGQLCSAVDKACVWYPKQAVCLQRSAVTACLLKSHGIPARLAIGVRPMPFLAHAWVEVDGSIVNDWAGVKKLYQSLAIF